MYERFALRLKNIPWFKSVTVHDTITSKDKNNFNLIRLIAALMVIYDHSFAFFNPTGYVHYATFLSGYWAVNIFFFISGILITQSYFNSKSSLRFWTMRFFRIWPALIVCIIFTALIAGPVLTTLSYADYFSNPAFRKYFINLALLRTDMAYKLPGVFEDNFYPDIVNGSLWTLPYEILCYIIVFIGLTMLTKTGIKGRRLINSFMVCGLTMLAILIDSVREYLLSLLRDEAFRRTLGFFASGIFTYFMSRSIRINIFILLAMIAISSMVIFDTNAPEYITDYLIILSFLYGVLYIASRPFLYRTFKISNDYSYGIYIYAFLVQQSIANYAAMSPYHSMLISFPVTIILGFLSWHLIEKRTLEFARNISKRFKAKY